MLAKGGSPMWKLLPYLAALLSLSAAFAQAPGTAAPRVLSRSELSYSDEARRAGVNATVVLTVTVGADGVPHDIQIARGAGFGLDEEALKAVSAWSFEPATKQGVAVPASAAVEANFNLSMPGHEGQKARLQLVNPGGQRPELLQGKIPANPPGAPAPSSLKVALTVAADGTVRELNVLESNPPEWVATAVPDLRQWRFSPPLSNGRPVEVQGSFLLSCGLLPGPARMPLPGSNGPLVTIAPVGPQDRSLPAPRLISPPDGATFDVYPRRTEFRWEPVPGAVSYILEWDYSSEGIWSAPGRQMLGTGYATQSTEFSFGFIGAQPGRWRVWPVSAAGLRGICSEWRTFRYLR